MFTFAGIVTDQTALILCASNELKITIYKSMKLFFKTIALTKSKGFLFLKTLFDVYTKLFDCNIQSLGLLIRQWSHKKISSKIKGSVGALYGGFNNDIDSFFSSINILYEVFCFG